MEAVGRQVPNKLGGLTPYKWSDLWYDLSLGRLLVDPGNVVGDAQVVSVDWYDHMLGLGN